MKWSTPGAVLASCVVAISGAAAAATPTARAANGETHIVGVNTVQTLDCGGGTLFVNGVRNYITALGTCWAVTTQGSANTVIADTIVSDVTVYGYDQTVYFHNGDPFLFDRGRELGMTNRLQRVPV